MFNWFPWQMLFENNIKDIIKNQVGLRGIINGQVGWRR